MGVFYGENEMKAETWSVAQMNYESRLVFWEDYLEVKLKLRFCNTFIFAFANIFFHYCSDFCNESNGIFVLGLVFFFRQVSTFRLFVLFRNLKDILPVIIFRKVMGV